MMSWFVHSEDKILGPYTAEKVLDDIKNGIISYSCFIWAKGQVEWISIADWEENLESYSKGPNSSTPQLWKLSSKLSQSSTHGPRQNYTSDVSV